jgi:hypothetical protein
MNSAAPDIVPWLEYVTLVWNFCMFAFTAFLFRLWPYWMSWLIASFLTYKANVYYERARAWWYGEEPKRVSMVVQGTMPWIVCYFVVLNLILVYVMGVRRDAKKRQEAAENFAHTMKVAKTYEETQKAFEEFCEAFDVPLPVVTEAKVSSFPNARATPLEEIEQKSNCVDSLDRIKVVNQDIWNVREVLPLPSVALNSVEQIRNRIKRNVYPVLVCHDTGQVETTLLGIIGDVAILNTHAFLPSSSWRVKIPANKDIRNTQHFHITRVYNSDRVSFGDDLTMIRVVGVNFKDIRDYFAPEFYPNAISVATYIGEERVRITNHPQLVHATTPGVPDTMLTTSYMYRLPSHKVGMCGMPLVSEVGHGWCIVGIHAAGSTLDEYAYATPVTRPQIDKAYRAHLQLRPIVEAASEGCVTTLPLVEPSPKSPWRYEHLDALRYFGKVDRDTHVKGKSEVVPSPLAILARKVMDFDLTDEEGPLFGAPPMRAFVRDGEYISPWNIALNATNHGQVSLDSILMEMTIRDILKHFAPMVRPLAPLTMQAAINGVVGDPLTRRINVSTSAGAILPGKKEQYLPIYSCEATEVLREPTRERLESICNIIRTLSQGECGHPIYGASLKDEVRSRNKIETGKTRVFYASPLDYLVVQRMYMYPFYATFSDNRDITCTLIGANMHMDSDEIFKDTVDFADKYLLWDYVQYDINTLQDVKSMWHTIVYEFAKQCGYTPFALRVLVSIMTDANFPLVLMNNDLYMACGLQPSGAFGTTDDNSGHNLVMQVYAFNAMKPDLSLNFFDHVRPRTNGDDNMGSVKDSVAHWFNAVTYAHFCKEVFKMTVSSADKKSELQPYVTKDKLEILKRTFCFSPTLGRVVAPLSKESLAKMVAFYIPSKAVSLEKQMCDTAVSFLTEWFFWCSTEEEYNQARNETIHQLQIKFDLLDADVEALMPSFKELVGRLKK